MFHKTRCCIMQMNRLFEVSMVAELLTRFYVWCQIFRQVAFLCNLCFFWFSDLMLSDSSTVSNCFFPH
jgi:hypothetical protein